MKHKVLIKQTFRVEREIVAEIDADDLDEAIDLVASGAVDVPSFDDPHWRTGWLLQSEGVEPALEKTI